MEDSISIIELEIDEQRFDGVIDSSDTHAHC